MCAYCYIVVNAFLLQSQYAGSVSTTTEEPQVPIDNLDTCTSYWVTITAISYCGLISTTEPILLGIKDSASYQLELNLPEDTPCSDWIKQNADAKIMDMEMVLMDAGTSEGLMIPCFNGSQWECPGDGDNKLVFR